MVFTPENFVKDFNQVLPRRTLFAGSLPISFPRCEQNIFTLDSPHKNFIVVCFGSVLDPADYLEIIELIIKIARQFKQNIIISTQNPSLIQQAEDIFLAPYLPLPQLLKKSSLFIHHGGANTFSESLTLGVPQIIIPLTTDQPIQAELLKISQAGIAIYPKEITEEKLYNAFLILLDKINPIHQHIHTVKKLYQTSTGAKTAASLIEQIIQHRVNANAKNKEHF
jgi:UDP:flavonoid glycosyltransferase YjiC (YdhE family)